MRIPLKTPEIVVAVDAAGGFGKDGKIPWSLPEDMKRFKELTSGHVCVMGKNTYNDLLDMRIKRLAKNYNKAVPMELITEILPGRETYVVTSDANYHAPGATVIDDMGLLMSRMGGSGDPRRLFVLGGKRMYIQALSWANIIHMTIVKGPTYKCDVSFPIQALTKYNIVSGQETDKAYYVVYQHK